MTSEVAEVKGIDGAVAKNIGSRRATRARVAKPARSYWYNVVKSRYTGQNRVASAYINVSLTPFVQAKLEPSLDAECVCAHSVRVGHS